MKEDEEQTIQQAWQKQVLAPNCWVMVQSKLAMYNKDLMRWSVRKLWLTQQELDAKPSKLNQLQNQINSDIATINLLKKEIGHWLEQ